MRLADDISVLRIGLLRPIRLRPSLRAALCLERAHGFEKLLSAIGDGNLTVISEIVAASSDHAEILNAIEGVPLIEVMPALIEAMTQHILALAGFDPDTPKQPNAGERITFAEYHAKLYRIATGWLGWSPQQAWAATSAEILEAYSGHLEMLRAIHGGAELENNTRNTPDSAPLDSAGLHRLKTLGGMS